MSFSEPVTLPDRPIVVTTQQGELVAVRVTTSQPGAGLVATPERPLAVGGYDVAYRVIGADGDLIAGTFAFGVAAPVAAAGSADRTGVSGSEPESVPVGSAAWRGLLFLGVAVGGGWLAWRVDHATGGVPGPRPLLRAGSAVALLAAVGLLVGLRGTGGLAGAATGPGVGRLLGLQAVLLAGAAVTARRSGRGGAVAALLLLVVSLEGARAHPAEAGGPLGAVLTVTHLLAGALWLGGLVQLLRVVASWRGRPKAVRVAVATYARNALVLFVVVSATGTVIAVLLLPDLDDWTTGRLDGNDVRPAPARQDHRLPARRRPGGGGPRPAATHEACPPEPAARCPGAPAADRPGRVPFGGFPLPGLAYSQPDGPFVLAAPFGGSLLVVGAAVTAGTGLAALFLLPTARTRAAAAGAAAALAALPAVAGAAVTTAPAGTLDAVVVQGGGPRGTRAVFTDPDEVTARQLAVLDGVTGRRTSSCCPRASSWSTRRSRRRRGAASSGATPPRSGPRWSSASSRASRTASATPSSHTALTARWWAGTRRSTASRSASTSRPAACCRG